MKQNHLPLFSPDRRRVLIGGALAALLPYGVAAGHDNPLPRLLAFGDSLTAGYGLPESKGLVPVLSQWLTRHDRPVTLLNAGLSGDTTYGGRVRIGWSLRQGADAVIVQLGGNDIVSGIPVRLAERNLDAILSRAGENGRPVLLVGIRTPAGHTDSDGWAALWPRLAQRHGCLLMADLYASFGADTPANRARFLQADGAHPSPEGVRRMTEDLGPRVIRLLDMLPPG